MARATCLASFNYEFLPQISFVVPTDFSTYFSCNHGNALLIVPLIAKKVYVLQLPTTRKPTCSPSLLPAQMRIPSDLPAPWVWGLLNLDSPLGTLT